MVTGKVTTANFRAWNNRKAELVAQGVKLNGPGGKQRKWCCVPPHSQPCAWSRALGPTIYSSPAYADSQPEAPLPLAAATSLLTPAPTAHRRDCGAGPGARVHHLQRGREDRLCLAAGVLTHASCAARWLALHASFCRLAGMLACNCCPKLRWPPEQLTCPCGCPPYRRTTPSPLWTWPLVRSPPSMAWASRTIRSTPMPWTQATSEPPWRPPSNCCMQLPRP